MALQNGEVDEPPSEETGGIFRVYEVTFSALGPNRWELHPSTRASELRGPYSREFCCISRLNQLPGLLTTFMHIVRLQL